MRKKLLYGICSFLLLFSLTACGSNEEVTYGGFTSSDFEQEEQTLIYTLENNSEADIENAIVSIRQNGVEVYAVAFENYLECKKLTGDFIGYGNFTLDKSGKTLTATLEVDYTNRDIKVISVYNVNKIEEGPTAVNIEPIYSLGETMQKAALNTVMGILIVFCMLVVMSIIISAFNLIPKIQAAFTKKSEDNTTVKAVTEVAPVASTSATDDLELVAVIAAAIAASTGASTDSFVVRSIKKRH